MKIKFLAAFFLLFILRICLLKLPDYPSGQEVKVIGRVINEPYLIDSNQIIKLDGIKVITEPFPQIFYGDKIEVFGKLEKRVIKNRKTEFILYYPQISILDYGERASFGIRLRRGLITLRRHLEGRFSAILPEPQASLLSGILLGARGTMPAEFFQSLQKTSTLHIIAASGYNISVVAKVLVSGLVLIIPRKKTLPFAFLGIAAYAFLAGAGPAVIRATIMGSLTYLAQFLGREREAVAALLFSAAIMLLFNPLIFFDIGFQLSFGATAGILFLLPFFEKSKIFKRNFFSQEIAITLSAQIAVLPIILYHFGSIGIFSPLVNSLVAPLIPYIMSFGGAVIFSSLISEIFARIIAIPAWVLLTVMVKLINFFGRISWSNLNFENFPLWGVIFYYLILMGVIVLFRKRLYTSEVKSPDTSEVKL